MGGWGGGGRRNSKSSPHLLVRSTDLDELLQQAQHVKLYSDLLQAQKEGNVWASTRGVGGCKEGSGGGGQGAGGDIKSGRHLLMRSRTWMNCSSLRPERSEAST